MFDINTTAVLIVSLLLLVSLGVHIAVALGITSSLGIFLVTGGRMDVVESMVASTAYEALRDYVFAVIPLFMLMGEFIGKSGAVTDVYNGINRALGRIPGRLALATVLGNAVFSFVTGVSIASAATFSRIAYPEMRRHGYDKGFALGAITGSSCLGMLIPPSVLMIVWGILTEQSIGRIFIAGILPGLMLVTFFLLYIIAAAFISPEKLGQERPGAIGTRVEVPETPEAPVIPETPIVFPLLEKYQTLISSLGILTVVVAVLGGIWLGFFTPTEGAGVGAFFALILGLLKGMRREEIVESIMSVGRTSAPILLLLLTAALYSRVLAMTGVSNALQDFFLSSGLPSWQILALMILVWFLLGTVIDSISIMLLTVPIFAPLAVKMGYDPIAFAILGILAIEAGLLTPPFGLLVYTVKAAVPDESISIGTIFYSSTPYWVALLMGVIAIANFPQIATFLPDLAL